MPRGSNLILLDPDVARAFPDPVAVNALLRAVAAATPGRAKKKTPSRLRSDDAYLERLMGGPLTLGGALSAIREAEGESLAQFAERLGVSRTHLSDIEHGRRSPSLQRAAELARALEHSEAQFVRLALQDQVRNAGLKLTVEVSAA